MRNIIKSIINVVCIVIILMNSIMLVFASGGGGGNDDDNDGNILNIAYDTDKRQSFSMVTDSVSSNSSQQGFCVGWTFEFSSIDGNTSTKIYVPIKNPDTNGGTHTYIMPLSNGWKGDSSNIDGGSSIFSLTTYQYTYSLLIKQGCKVTANARIEKFSYNSYTGKYTSMGVYADNPAELKKVFSGFSDDFITNTIKDYFNWSNTLDPEPQTVHIQYWDKTTGQKMSINQADVTVASSDLTTRTFEPVTIPTGYEIVGNRLQYDSLMPSNWDDYSIWDKTIHFPLDGLHLEGWLNIQMALKPYTNTVHVQYWDQSGKKLNINQSDIRVKDNKSVTKGFVLSNEIPAGYKIIGKKLQHIPDLPRDWEDYSKWDKLLNFPLDQPEGYLNILLSRQTGIIHIACIDSSNNEVIDNRVLTASLNIPQIVSSPEKSGYSPKGSYSTFITNSSVPSSSNMQRGILSQSVTLSEAHPDAYVYFWYDKVEGPVAVIDAPTTVQAGEKVSISGSHSYTKQSGIKITKYDWDIPGGNASFTTADGETVYNTPGTYTIHLTVTDSNGLTGSTTHVIEVTPPIPTARMEVAGKIKENRKITVDARNSDSPQNYSIDWNSTRWHIEPDIDSGAQWEIGVRLQDGTVRKIDERTDQSFLTGQSYFYFQARCAGTYRVTLTVTNTYPVSCTYTGSIVISKDLPPVAGCIMQENNLREYENPIDGAKQKFSIVPVYDSSSSPDGDLIVKRTWGFRWNSQNNVDAHGEAILSDDVTVYKYTGDTSRPFLPGSGQRLIVENDNDTTVEIWSYDIGMYYPEITVEEGIPDDETIKELLLPSDIRKATIDWWKVNEEYTKK